MNQIIRLVLNIKFFQGNLVTLEDDSITEMTLHIKYLQCASAKLKSPIVFNKNIKGLLIH